MNRILATIWLIASAGCMDKSSSEGYALPGMSDTPETPSKTADDVCAKVKNDYMKVANGFTIFEIPFILTCDHIINQIGLIQKFINRYEAHPDFSCTFTIKSDTTLDNPSVTKTRQSILAEANSWLSEAQQISSDRGC